MPSRRWSTTPSCTGRLRTDLKAVPDLARALTRLALERGGPRDLAAIGKAIGAASALSRHFAAMADIPAILARLAQDPRRCAPASGLRAGPRHR